MIPTIRWRQLGPTILLGLHALAWAMPLAAQEAPEDFGRWLSEVRACRLGMAPGPALDLRCDGVRLDQQLPGLLSVRFFSRGQGPAPAKRLLVFAGILERGSPAMACRGGSCQWSSPMRTRVTALADLGVSERGDTTSLPTTRLAQGTCLIQAKRIRCEAKAEGEGAWWAQADR